MSSVDKQLLFSAYEVASLYVYNMLQPTYQDFNWCLIDNQVDKNEDHYAHLEIYTNHNIYKDMTKDLLQSISNTSQCINPTDIEVQQFSRPFLLDWFKNKGLECPALCLPFNKKKVLPQKPEPNITINITSAHNKSTKDKSDVEVSQSSNKEHTQNPKVKQHPGKETPSIAPSNSEVIVSMTQVTLKVNSKKNCFAIEAIFGKKKNMPRILFLALAKSEGRLSEQQFKQSAFGSTDASRRQTLKRMNARLKEKLLLNKIPFKRNTEVYSLFKKIHLVEIKNQDALDHRSSHEDIEAASDEIFRNNPF